MTDTIHVLLADDHDLVRGGLKAAIRNHPEFSVVAEARDGEEAVREAQRVQPELVVMDVRMPKMTGIEACRESGDNNTRQLLEKILADEEEHVDWIEAQIDQVAQVGIQNYLAQQIKEGE